jgi:hypothetical protein
MKLFVIDKESKRKIYLNVLASDRNELANIIGSPKFIVKGEKYHVNEVFAEPENNTAAGALIGGLVGVLGGPIGVLLGGTLGGIIGNNSDKKEKTLVEKFNNSIYNNV